MFIHSRHSSVTLASWSAQLTQSLSKFYLTLQNLQFSFFGERAAHYLCISIIVYFSTHCREQSVSYSSTARVNYRITDVGHENCLRHDVWIPHQCVRLLNRLFMFYTVLWFKINRIEDTWTKTLLADPTMKLLLSDPTMKPHYCNVPTSDVSRFWRVCWNLNNFEL